MGTPQPLVPLRWLTEAISARDEMEAVHAELLEALKVSYIAIDDWLNTYASDHCDENRVMRARQHIADAGGTLAYIADIQQQNRQALARAEGRE